MSYRDIIQNSLWKQNPGLVQLLGLCPLLAMSNSVVNAAGLGIATIIVMALSNGAVSLLRSYIPFEIRIPVFILIIAALVTGIDLAMNAWLHPLYVVLGIFTPLIVTNCIVLARVEAFANKNPPLQSLLDGVFMGVGMLWTLALLGGLRELIGGKVGVARHQDLGGRAGRQRGGVRRAGGRRAVRGRRHRPARVE